MNLSFLFVVMIRFYMEVSEFHCLIPSFFFFIFISGAVIQLKTMVGAIPADESFSNLIVEKMGFLQRVLVYVVSIICCFIDLNSNVYEKAQMYSITEDFSVIGALCSIDPDSLKDSLSERTLHWHRKAVVSVMEAGGLNWLVGKVGIFVYHHT